MSKSIINAIRPISKSFFSVDIVDNDTKNFRDFIVKAIVSISKTNQDSFLEPGFIGNLELITGECGFIVQDPI
jgi:hypothetical protein